MLLEPARWVDMSSRSPESFWAYLKAQRFRRDRVGDLSRDAVTDPIFPRKTQGDQHDYLHSVGAVTGAYEALSEAWLEYQEYARKHR